MFDCFHISLIATLSLTLYKRPNLPVGPHTKEKVSLSLTKAKQLVQDADVGLTSNYKY